MLYKRLIINGEEYLLAVNKSGQGAPTESTVGAPGVLYMDTDTEKFYKCTAALDGVYTWKKFETGGTTGSDSSENVNGGMSTTAANLLITILRNVSLYSTDQSANITALAEALAATEEEEPDTPVEPDVPDDPDAVTHTVTNKLTNVTTNNATASVTDGASYSATLTAAEGYVLDAVTVTMGGVDITSTVYLNGSVDINTVSGDIVITATAVGDITAVVVEMVSQSLSRDQVTIYTDEGITVDEGVYNSSIGTAVVSSMAFSSDTKVRVTRKRASEGSTWTTVLIGESDPSDLTKIYNAVVHDCQFANETIERPHDYTVHAGRKLVVRYYTHLSSGILVTSSSAPDIPDPDIPVDSEVAMTYNGVIADNGSSQYGVDNYTIYTDEGETAIEYTVTNPAEYLSGRYISVDAFDEDTDVIITRSAFSGSAWDSILIGELDESNESIVYNAFYSQGTFTTSTEEKTYNYTVHAGRKLIIFRRSNNYNNYTLTVTK